MPKPEEWLKQSDYDMDTAEYMFNGGRYFYAVFMCHLAMEKALKGLYHKRLRETPPKIHNLVFLVNSMKVTPPEAMGRFLVRLNEASVVTRYPEEIGKLQKDFTMPIVRELLSQGREVLQWIKEQF
ncbi:MAG: HEPN domain-containing protein [Nitrospirae bacterium]|nr:HEPN domain-containing protein [Nitrospirota bacterium]